jgi:hypothetical protein
VSRRAGRAVERTFAHAYETGGLRRLYVRGKQNVQKRATATSGGMQSGAAAQKDDGSGYATGTSRRGGAPFFRSFAPYLGYQRDPRDFALAVGFHIAPGTPSESMFWTENSMPENRRFRHGLVEDLVALWEAYEQRRAERAPNQK